VTAPRRTAVIDLGSNTFRLVVFEAGAGPWWRRMDELPDRIRISEGADATGRLGEEPMARALAALEIYGRYCEAQHLDEVHAVATSAIRDAENGEAFLSEATRALGHEVRILSAEEEASAGYVAAVNSTTLRDGAVLDLGGGSIQLTRVAGRAPAESGSWPLGAVRMTERFLPGGEASKEGMKAVRRHAQKKLAKVEWLMGTDRIVALGGAARNLAAAAVRRSGELLAGSVQGVELTQEALASLRDELAALPPGERGEIPGINERRADVILAAAIVLHEVLELADADRFEVTEWGMREGLFLASHLDADPPVVPDVRRSAVEQLAHRFSPDLSHPRQVARLAAALWDGLAGAGAPCAPEDRELVWAAGLLHDVGTAIDLDDRHKHSHYLVENAGLPGYAPREVALVASAARYHHKGSPDLEHPVSEAGDEERLARMAAVLRLAEDLDRARDGAVHDVRVAARNGSLRLGALGEDTRTVLLRAIERNGRLFRLAFGKELKAAKNGNGNGD
jgi:exopolyphosphatase/guanosine-5'-triphosphate,3'-diphosphate pyrophosphatase